MILTSDGHPDTGSPKSMALTTIAISATSDTTKKINPKIDEINNGTTE